MKLKKKPHLLPHNSDFSLSKALLPQNIQLHLSFHDTYKEKQIYCNHYICKMQRADSANRGNVPAPTKALKHMKHSYLITVT